MNKNKPVNFVGMHIDLYVQIRAIKDNFANHLRIKKDIQIKIERSI